MTRSEIKTSLEAVYPQELTDALLTSYEHAIIEYRKSHWQYFGNEIGQFIEVARRIIEYQLSGNYTPLADRLTIFSEKVLISLESHSSAISEVYRVLIPRTLYAMYCLRNKRGMIHKSSIDPNKMDATVLLGNAKWILAEFFRLASTLPFEETEAIIESIICRETSVVWDTGTSLRILDTRMSAKDKVLCLLYVKDRQSELELQTSIEYKNGSEFKKILRGLHKDKLVEYSEGKCMLSPIGVLQAEVLLTK